MQLKALESSYGCAGSVVPSEDAIMHAWSRQEWGLGKLPVVGHHHGLLLMTHVGSLFHSMMTSTLSVQGRAQHEAAMGIKSVFLIHLGSSFLQQTVFYML